MQYPKAVQELIKWFSTLPTVGPKTAERYVFYLLRQRGDDMQKFAQSLAELKEKTITCKTCLAIADTNPCDICANSKRDKKTLSIVATTRDLISIERTRQYNGLYHVLGGLLDAVNNIGPKQLNIKPLLDKIKKNQVKEIILSLNPTLEGETTSMYLTKSVKKLFPKIKITRLAKGLPMGADLEYADDQTIKNALKFRNEV